MNYELRITNSENDSVIPAEAGIQSVPKNLEKLLKE